MRGEEEEEEVERFSFLRFHRACVFFRLSLSLPFSSLFFPERERKGESLLLVPEITTSAPPLRDRLPSDTSNVRMNSFTCRPSSVSWSVPFLARSTAKAQRWRRGSEVEIAIEPAASSPGGGAGVIAAMKEKSFFLQKINKSVA